MEAGPLKKTIGKSTVRTPYARAPRGSRAGGRWTRGVFTLNNYTEKEFAWFAGQDAQSKFKWLICARETGENGTPHLQGNSTL